jgi:hypothetical protein
MIGTVIAWDDKFIVISTGEEVYRTENNPYGDVYVEGSVSLDVSVEFEVINNRAVNIKRLFFAPDMTALRKNIHKIEVFNENEACCDEMENEGSKRYENFGRLALKLTKNPNTLDVILPVVKELGLNLCNHENKPIKLTVMDGNKAVDVYDHSFNVGIVSTLTRVKDSEAEKKAWAEYEQFSHDMNTRYFEMCFKHIDIVNIQKKLYFGSKLSRKYNQFKFSSAKYDNTKI